MFKKGSLFLMLLASLSCLGQNSRFDVNAKTGFLYYSQEANSKASNIAGSQYVDSNFITSQVKGYSGITPQIRYNAYKDEMEFVEGGKTYYVTKNDSLEIKLATKSYKYIEYPIEKGEEKGFLIALTSGDKAKFTLYKKEKVILVPEYDSGSGYRDPVPAHFKLDEDKFYLGQSDKVVFMPKKEKEILALIPDKGVDIKKFIKDNKTSFKKEEDLVKLINFLNTL